MTREGRTRNLLVGIAKVVGALLLLIVAGLLTDHILSLPPLALGPLRGIGFALLVVGLYLEIRATQVLWSQGRGTPNPVDPPRRLVGTGPYRYSRNPLYLARIALLSSSALLLASPGIIVVVVVLFLALHLLIVPREEARLHERYGAEYESYRKCVPRWVLPIRKSRH